jgi:polar amino acid transport system substrate-binding protein
MALDPGSTLLNGQYRIERELGRGGFGFVYLAQDTLLSEPVAIKELIPGLVGSEEMLKRFLAEAKATMRLTHERIVRTHNVFGEAGNYYIIMEYMPGGSLEAWLRDHGRLSPNDAVRVATDVCRGLSYAHDRGVVHCDLKPANILFAADGSAKVADFGIAHVSEQMLTRTWLTPAGFVAGTLPYMSPEQVDGVRDDPRVDVYALGAVTFRALTGRTYLDFDERETPGAQADNVQRIRREPPNPPSSYSASVPPRLDGVVMRALAKNPDRRYATTEAFAAALTGESGSPARSELETQPAARREAQTVAVGPRPVAPPRQAGPASAAREHAVQPGRPSSRPKPWMWIAGAGLALLVAVAAVFLLTGGEGQQPALQPTLTSRAAAVVTRTSRPEPTGTSQPELRPSDTAAPDTAYDLLGKVLAAGRLVVASDSEYPPLSFLNDAGEVDGFDVNVAQEIAKRLDVAVEFVTPEFSSVVAGNWDRSWDLAIDSMAQTPERENALLFTQPYYYIPYSFAVHRDNTDIRGPDDLSGKTVGSGEYGLSRMYLTEDDFGLVGEAPIYSRPTNLTLETFPSDWDALQNLAEGDGIVLDGAMSDRVSIQAAMDSGLAVKPLGSPAFYEPLAIALDRGAGPSDQMLAKVNELLEEMHADGTLTALSEKWFGVDVTKKAAAN